MNPTLPIIDRPLLAGGTELDYDYDDDPNQAWLFPEHRRSPGVSKAAPTPCGPATEPTLTPPPRDYRFAGCVLLAGAILCESKPNAELLSRLRNTLQGAITLDRLAAASRPAEQLHLNVF